MTQNPFQPWKPSFAPSSSFYRKASGGENDLISAYKPSKSAGDGVLSYAYDMNAQDSLQQMYQSTTAPPMTTSSSSNSVSDSDQHQQHQQSSSSTATPAKAQQSSKFSIFSQLLNLNKIQSFDNLLINATLDDDDLSADKRHGIRKLMEQAISDESKQQIAFILDKISALRPAEKLLLYLKMPGGHSDVDPLKVSQNPLGSRSEITHTINWVRSHLEHDEKVSIPKQEVYEDYVSFCAKINIKPLSTADFGKVMKQVFPDIKPRRLGTRGHSRYCYAAMRKATKLPPPFLPDLSIPSSSESSSQAASGEIDDSSTWQTIKTWSETLLSEQFESLDDLANHIKHNVNGSSSSSKSALQKKLLQREFRDKKKNCNIQLMAKKRRKKRRISSDSTQENQFNENIQIKQEKETDVSAGENNLSEDSSELPMNLTNSDRFHNDIVDFSKAIPKDEAIECLKNKLDQKFTSDIANEEIFSQDSTSQEQQYMLCKKVRQAQQMKLTANQNSIIGGSQFNESSIVSLPVVANLVESTVNDMLMPSKIPPKRKLKKDSDLQNKKSKSNSSQESPYSSSLNQVDQATDFEMEKEDFILPRERFISICNMDKNALDTYLNPSGENSPDYEMMQYFDEDDKSKNESDEEDLGQAPTSVPLLENYQLVSEGRASDNKAIDKISQLRSMLEEHNQKSMSINDSSLIKNLLQKSSTAADVINSSNSQMTSYGTSGSCFLAATRTTTNSTMPLRAYDENEKLIPHSPNTRRKNFSFVPISDHSTRVRNINLHPAFKDDFVSPRATSVNRRTSNSSMNMRNNMSAVDPKPIPLLGVNNTAFSACRPVNFKIEPDSEPSSPSMNQNFNYSPQSTQHQSHFQFQSLNGDQANYDYPVETRSQSVPPHCTNNSNMFNNNRANNNNGYNGYSSACSSMAPTPVPPDYQEFSDPNILDIFDNEQQTSSAASVKLESNDDVIDLLDSEILNSDSNHQQQQQTARQSFTISRSVPNTPLPFHTSYINGNSMNAFSCMSGKSVPTTPVGQNGHFRYSPELQRTRDFLINGYNNNNNISAVNHNDKLIKDNNGSLSSDIDELSNLDANCFGTL